MVGITRRKRLRLGFTHFGPVASLPVETKWQHGFRRTKTRALSLLYSEKNAGVEPW